MIRMEAHLVPDADRALLDRVAKFTALLRLDEKGKLQNAAQARSQIEKAVPAKPKAPARKTEATSKRGGDVRTGAAPGIPDRVRTGNLGELEVAVSRNGLDVVVATNRGFSFSNDSGETFADGGGTPQPDCCSSGDPSVAWGASGRFYYAFIGLPNGSDAWDGTAGCSTAISVSTNRGRNFNWLSNATLCPRGAPGLCFPDQEHIAADRVNSAPGGGDQVYSVWRNFVPTGGPAACDLFSGVPAAAIVCSQDSASSWSLPAAIDAAGDFPRVTVGGDGSVYVTYVAGANIMLNKFSSCAVGLAQQEGFPVTVTAFTGVRCPVAGLDRCNNGNVLASPTVAVDAAEPNRLFLAVADETVEGNENVVVFESIDGGATWPRSTPANALTPGRRFMPWVCSADRRAFVGWYDRRASVAEGVMRPDLTEYFLGEVLVRTGNLVSGFERNLSGVPDPQCASGFECGARSRDDANDCPGAPPRLGVCVAFGGEPTGATCDLAVPGGCLGGLCVPGPGCPKYGDYNGIACSDDSVYVAWASATLPAGVDGVSRGIDVFAERVVVRESEVDRLCRSIRGCIDVFEMKPGLLRLLCPDRNCLIIDPLPQNCLVKWGCPGCKPGMLCPPFYDIVLEGITKEDWKVSLVDFDGRPVQHKVRSADGRTIVSFRPDKASFREGSIGDYALVFTPGPKHVAGRIYDVKTRLEVGDEPFGGSKK
ncbi:MAG TPA: hypothetical protein VEK57_31575 [Thermoanaerobaculia bacterium]|nr:hypothetical protein [Thermoanaerobaculia bacterium]